MASLYTTAKTFIEAFMTFGGVLWRALNAPFAYLPAYFGLNPEINSGFFNLWAGFMSLIGYIDETGVINDTTTLELLGGAGLSAIIIIILYKFLRGIVFN